MNSVFNKALRLIGKRRKVITVACVIALTAALWRAVVVYRRPPLLLSVYTKVLNLRGYTTLEGGVNDSYTYQWLDENHLLLARTVKHKVQFVRFNILNHHSVPLTGLSSQFNRHRCLPKDTIARLSPDGRWLLWNNYDHGTTFYCSSIDGNRLLTWPVRADMLAGDEDWLPGSRRWVVVVFSSKQRNKAGYLVETGYMVFNVDKPKETKLLYIRGPIIPIKYQPGYDLLCTSSNCQMFYPGRPGAGRNDPALISQTGLQRYVIHPAHPLAVWKFQTYDHLRDYQVAINQRGRMALLAMNNDSMYIVVGWPDGTDCKVVGTIPFTVRGIELDEIRWQPDCSHISFRYKHDLYTVPAR